MAITFSRSSFLAVISVLATSVCVNAHGQVHHVIANGVTNNGPNQYYSLDVLNKKTATRVMYKASSPSYVLFSDFGDNTKMSCEGSAASPAPATLPVTAGGTLEVFWAGATGELLGQPGTGGITAYDPWVHAMGPIQDYITSCNGDCSSFDATSAGWTKLAGSGIDPSSSISDDLRNTMKAKPEEYYPTGKGLWAMARMVEAGSKWDITIPQELADGQYIVRHELSAMHNPKVDGDATTGPQLYIACIQIDVSGGGSTKLPTGVQASDLYDPNGDFAEFNVYSGDANDFVLPGPPVFKFDSGSSIASGTSSALSVSTSTSTVAVASTQSESPSPSAQLPVSASSSTSTSTSTSTHFTDASTSTVSQLEIPSVSLSFTTETTTSSTITLVPVSSARTAATTATHSAASPSASCRKRVPKRDLKRHRRGLRNVRYPHDKN